MKIFPFLFLLLLIISACTIAPESKFQIVVGLNDTTLLKEPFGMCANADGDLFIADVGKCCISKVNNKGVFEIYAGTGDSIEVDGNIKKAAFNCPAGICFDKQNNMYVAGFGGQNVRKITSKGQVTTIAGTAAEGYRDGAADSALFSSPRGICVDSKGYIYVADCWNHRIRKISPDGTVITFAGGGARGELVPNAWEDGADTTARFDAPCGLSIDKNDNIYVADAFNNSIRKITPDGHVSTLAGINRRKGFADGDKETALLNVPTEVFVDSDGTVFFSDTYNHCIRAIDTNGYVSTVAGTGEKGLAQAETEPLQSLLSNPRGLCIYSGYLYFVEWDNHTLRKMKL